MTTLDAPKPTIAVLVDEHGRKHWTAYGSAAHKRLTESATAEEVADAGTEVPAPGGDLDAGSTEDGPSDPQRSAGDADDGGGPRVSRAKPRR